MGVMKYLIVLFCLISFAADAQIKQQLGTYGVRGRRIQMDSAGRVPTVQVGIRDNYAGFDTAQVYYSKADSSLKVYTGSQWLDAVRGGGGGTAGWSLDGNAGTSGKFLGTTDAQGLVFKTNNATRLSFPAGPIQPGLAGDTLVGRNSAGEVKTLGVGNGDTILAGELGLGGQLKRNTTINANNKVFRIDSALLYYVTSYKASTGGRFSFLINRSTDKQHALDYSSLTLSSELQQQYTNLGTPNLRMNAYVTQNVANTGYGVPQWAINSGDSSFSANADKYTLDVDSSAHSFFKIGRLKTPTSATNIQMIVRDSTDGQIYRYPVSSGVSTPGLQAVITQDPDLTTNNTIDGGGNTLSIENNSNVQIGANTVQLTSEGGGTTTQLGIGSVYSQWLASRAGAASSMEIWPDSAIIRPDEGILKIDTLLYQNNSNDSMMVWRPTTGRVGMRAIPAGGGSGLTIGTTTVASAVEGAIHYTRNGKLQDSTKMLYTPAGDFSLSYGSVNSYLFRQTGNTTNAGLLITGDNASYAAYNAMTVKHNQWGSSLDIIQGERTGFFMNNSNGAGIYFSDGTGTNFLKISSTPYGSTNPTVEVNGYGTTYTALQVNGSLGTAYVAKTATYTATGADFTINCTANTFTVTLPTAVGFAGRIYTIVNSGAGVITIATTSSQTFANVALTPTTLTLSAVGSYMVQSTGAGWIVIGNL